MKSLVVYCFLTYVYSLSTLAQGIIYDRLILEINGKSYSQRQIEIYLVMRNLVMDPKSSMAQIEAEQWPEGLEIFQNEMLIFNAMESEPEKFATLSLNSNSQRLLQERLKELLATNDKWRDFSQRYHIRDKEVMELLAKMLKVQAFLERMKQPPLVDIDRSPLINVDTGAPWFLHLSRGTPVRLFDRARVYLKIKPFGA